MIAPEPFFEPRGTPFSEFHRIRALTALGHHVDLVTYPFGQNVAMPGLRVFRSLRPPFVERVKIGPSLAKIPLDALLALSALRRAVTGRYDAIHSHEEGGIIGALLALCLRLPHLYDMHSSLPQQLSNFAFSRSPLIKRVFLAIERFMIRRSRVVIVICPSLEETVKAIEPDAQTVLIENAPGSAEDEATPAAAEAVRRSLNLDTGSPIVLYTGTFEAYQGLDLLFASMAIGAGPTRASCSRAGIQIKWRRRATRRALRASRRLPCSPVSAPRRKSRRIFWPPTCSCLPARGAPTRRSRFTSTCVRGRRSWPRAC